MTEALEQAGLQAEPEFNALQGARRQIWWTADRTTHVDVFLGEFTMCHSLDLDQRLPADHPALAAADLLLMKLQVVELNHKDVTDAAALLTTHRLGDDDAAGSINRQRIVEVLAGDWGFYTTATDNLERLPELVAAARSRAGANGRGCRGTDPGRGRRGAQVARLQAAGARRAPQALVRGARRVDHVGAPDCGHPWGRGIRSPLEQGELRRC